MEPAVFKATVLKWFNDDGEKAPERIEDRETYFFDGVDKIDFILVYITKQKNKIKNHENVRKKYLKNLSRAGLHLEEVTRAYPKGKIHYVKVHAPWTVLTEYAQLLELRVPLEVRKKTHYNWSEVLLRALHIPNCMINYAPSEPLRYMTAVFQKDKVDKYLWHGDKDLFSNDQRIVITYEIINSVSYQGPVGLGLAHLLHSKIFIDAYPLHDGLYKYQENDDVLNMRQILARYWASWKSIFKYQPHNHIQRYFGAKIAFYYAWVGFYISWLVPYAFLSIFVGIYQIYTFFKDPSANEICNSGQTYKMCPLCDHCPYWYVSDACFHMRLEAAVDNIGTLVFAIISNIWAISFVCCWERTSRTLAYEWSTYDLNPEEERPRPEFRRRAKYMRINPVTGREEEDFPKGQQIARLVFAYTTIVALMIATLIAIMSLFIYQKLMSETYASVTDPLSAKVGLHETPIQEVIPIIIHAAIQIMILIIMEEIYVHIARRLTDWEMHRTETEYENNIIFKIFLFQFVDYNASFIYIAYFKGKIDHNTYPKLTGNQIFYTNLPSEQCIAGACFVEITIQLIITIICKYSILVVREWFKPYLLLLFRLIRKKPKAKGHTRWEMDYRLVATDGVYRQFLRFALQFSFITVFIVAFPMAPFFALIVNLVLVRMQAKILLLRTRRPVPKPARDIGIMRDILHALCKIAIVVNASLMAFSSEMIPRFIYSFEKDWDLTGYTNFTMSLMEPSITQLDQSCHFRNLYLDKDGTASHDSWRIRTIKFIFVFIYEHTGFLIHYIVTILVPHTPHTVKVKIRREQYLAKRALTSNE